MISNWFVQQLVFHFGGSFEFPDVSFHFSSRWGSKNMAIGKTHKFGHWLVTPLKFNSSPLRKVTIRKGKDHIPAHDFLGFFAVKLQGCHVKTQIQFPIRHFAPLWKIFVSTSWTQKKKRLYWYLLKLLKATKALKLRCFQFLSTNTSTVKFCIYHG